MKSIGDVSVLTTEVQIAAGLLRKLELDLIALCGGITSKELVPHAAEVKTLYDSALEEMTLWGDQVLISDVIQHLLVGPLHTFNFAPTIFAGTSLIDLFGGRPTARALANTLFDEAVLVAILRSAIVVGENPGPEPHGYLNPPFFETLVIQCLEALIDHSHLSPSKALEDRLPLLLEQYLKGGRTSGLVDIRLSLLLRLLGHLRRLAERRTGEEKDWPQLLILMLNSLCYRLFGQMGTLGRAIAVDACQGNLVRSTLDQTTREEKLRVGFGKSVPIKCPVCGQDVQVIIGSVWICSKCHQSGSGS